MDFLYRLLTEEGISVFVDEHSLVPGTPEAWHSITAALKAAAVGVPNMGVNIFIILPAGSCSMPAPYYALRKLSSAFKHWSVLLPSTGIALCQPGSNRVFLPVVQWWWCCRQSLCASSAPWRSWKSC